MKNSEHLIDRRRFLKGSAAAALAPAALGGALQAQASPQGGGSVSTGATAGRPNLLYVFTDQQSFDMLGCYGNEQVHTPAIDRMAGEGVRFTSAFSTFPVCTPYRGMLMSGQHALYNGCCRNEWQLLTDAGPSFGEVLRDAGYRCGYVGKWHLYGGDRNRPVPAGPHRHGFDGTFLTNNCAVDYRPGAAFYWDGDEKVKFGEWEQFGQTGQALDFLNRCSPDDDDPFALFVSWHPPHDHSPGKPESNGYLAPDPFYSQHEPLDKIRLRPDQDDDLRHRRMMRGHMALVDTIDVCMAQIEAKLAERGLKDNTLVVFTSDHGDMLTYLRDSDRRMVKTRPEPTSAQVPMIMRFPGRLRPRSSDLLFGTLDIMPTILTMLGIEPPASCQGRDLARDIARGNDDAVEDLHFYSLLGRPGWRGVITREHVYSTYFGRRRNYYPDNYQLLIERASDPYVRNNLYGERAARALQENLHRRTIQWMERYGDRGWEYRDLERLCMADQQAYPRRSGALKGRPIDIMRESGVKGILDENPSPGW